MEPADPTKLPVSLNAHKENVSDGSKIFCRSGCGRLWCQPAERTVEEIKRRRWGRAIHHHQSLEVGSISRNEDNRDINNRSNSHSLCRPLSQLVHRASNPLALLSSKKIPRIMPHTHTKVLGYYCL